MKTLAVVVVVLLAGGACGAPTADLVQNLPGLNFTPSFDSYSGYFKASDTKRFHYWFTKAESNPDTAPVLLWLNGGPGCSSLGGLIEELGPFHVSNNAQTVYHNPYAWNKVGNVIFLESPAGVGFSYATDGNEVTDDDEVAQNNYQALVEFFTIKFPEYKRNDFYITGESYGGVYVPTLAVKVAADKTNFPNFKGVAIGNGIYSFHLNFNTMVPLYYYHGLVRQVLYDKVATQCCKGNTYNCDYYSMLNSTKECAILLNELYNQVPDVNRYNLYATCYLDSAAETKQIFTRNMLYKMAGLKPAKQSDVFQANGYLPLCAQFNNTEAYLNRADVRKALHIPDNVGHWTNCRNKVGDLYTSTYDNMKFQFQSLIEKKIRILTYNGDVDTVCNFALNTKFIDSLGLQLKDGKLDSVEWFYHGETPNVAGFLTRYTNDVDFLTVRGAGHHVPKEKPRESLQMIYNFINERDYSSPVPF